MKTLRKWSGNIIAATAAILLLMFIVPLIWHYIVDEKTSESGKKTLAKAEEIARDILRTETKDQRKIGEVTETVVNIKPGEWSPWMDVSKHTWNIKNTFGDLIIFETTKHAETRTFELKDKVMTEVTKGKEPTVVTDLNDFARCHSVRIQSTEEEAFVLVTTYTGRKM